VREGRGLYFRVGREDFGFYGVVPENGVMAVAAAADFGDGLTDSGTTGWPDGLQG
jgi:hypothetical protein